MVVHAFATQRLQHRIAADEGKRAKPSRTIDSEITFMARERNVHSGAKPRTSRSASRERRSPTGSRDKEREPMSANSPVEGATAS